MHRGAADTGTSNDVIRPVGLIGSSGRRDGLPESGDIERVVDAGCPRDQTVRCEVIDIKLMDIKVSTDLSGPDGGFSTARSAEQS